MTEPTKSDVEVAERVIRWMYYEAERREETWSFWTRLTTEGVSGRLLVLADALRAAIDHNESEDGPWSKAANKLVREHPEIDP